MSRNGLYNEKEILERIKELAKYYAPQWNTGSDDAGMAFAKLFSELMAENWASYPRMIERHHLLFLNMYGLEKRPYYPAMGYVSVTPTLGNSVNVKKGSRLSSDEVEFETAYDLYAASTKITDVFCTSKNVICQSDVHSFFNTSGDNLQETSIYFSADEILYSDNDCVFTVAVFDSAHPDQRGIYPPAQLDIKKIKWEYLSQKESIEITDCKQNGNQFTLTVPQPIPQVEFGGISGRWIKLVFTDGNIMRYVSQKTLLLTAKANETAPQSLYCNDNMLAKADFMPFGEQPSEYDCFYICSSKCFSKKNSVITISLDYSFTDIDVNSYAAVEANWKTIMPASKFTPKPPLIKLCEKVIWEYWNGRGWCRLYNDDSHTADFANIENTSLKIIFTCPDDIDETFAGADNGLFVRCRIEKITMGFAENLVYRMPLVSKISVSYDYKGSLCSADHMFISNNLEVKEVGTSPCRIDNTENAAKAYTYLCFDEPLPLGYTNVYFRFDTVNTSKLQTEWESLSVTHKEQGWSVIGCSDKTLNFTEDGVITFSITNPMAKALLFGKEGYWLRVNADNQINSISPKAIYLNTVAVVQHEKRSPMYFTVQPYADNAEFSLSAVNISKISVKVLDNENWNEIDDDKYTLDRENGIIKFNKGFMPISSEEPTVCVSFSVTSGDKGNLPPDSINRFLDPLPFIDVITNPEKTYGGRDVETNAECVERGMNKVKTLDRCVSSHDYEITSLSADKAIVRVKCIQSEKNIRLVVLTDTNESNAFELIKKHIIEKITPVMPFYFQDRLTVEKPEYIYIQAVVHILSDGLVFPQMINSEITEKLQDYINAVSGNDGNGFEIGEFPDTESIKNLILSVSHVKNIELLQLLCNSEKGSFDYEQLNLHTTGVVMCEKPVIYIDEHNINIF